MAITATFYSFAKRENSTKKPSGNGYVVNVLLKEPCDLERPTIEVHDQNILAYNYCYLSLTNRYYFVDGRESIANNTYIITLTEDYAASHIDAVRGQNVYAVMSSYAYEPSIDDTRCVPTENITRDVTYHNCEVMIGTNYAYEFMSVINNDGKMSGIDIFYDIQGYLAGDFLKACADVNWLQYLGQQVGQVSPLDYVNAAWLCPFDPAQCHDVGTNTADLLSVPMSGDCILNSGVKQHHEFFTIPRPSTNDFRYSDKYVKYYMNLPCIGVITLPTTLLRHADVVRVDYAGDCLSGNLVFKVSAAGIGLGYYSTSLRQDIPLSRQGNRTASAIVDAALGGIGGAALGSKGGLAGAIAGGVLGSAYGTFMGAYSMPDGRSILSNSGSLALYGARGASTDIELWIVESESDVDPATFAAVAGRPTEKVIAIANGYLLTRNASVSFAGTASEIEAFNTLLDGGLYVE